jgi:hypothetical protein
MTLFPLLNWKFGLIPPLFAVPTITDELRMSNSQLVSNQRGTWHPLLLIVLLSDRRRRRPFLIAPRAMMGRIGADFS